MKHKIYSFIFWGSILYFLTLSLMGCGTNTIPDIFHGCDDSCGPRPYLTSDGKEVRYKFTMDNDFDTYRSGSAVLSGVSEDNEEELTIVIHNLSMKPNEKAKVFKGAVPYSKKLVERSISGPCASTFTSNQFITEENKIAVTSSVRKLEKPKPIASDKVSMGPLVSEIIGNRVVWKTSFTSKYKGNVRVDFTVTATDSSTCKVKTSQRSCSIDPMRSVTCWGEFLFDYSPKIVPVHIESTNINLGPIPSSSVPSKALPLY